MDSTMSIPLIIDKLGKINWDIDSERREHYEPYPNRILDAFANALRLDRSTVHQRC